MKRPDNKVVLWVSPDTHKQIHQIKIQKGLKSVEEVLKYLMEGK